MSTSHLTPNSSQMRLDSRIYIAGHRGLVGSAIVRRLTTAGHENILTRTHAELDLTDQLAVRDFFQVEKPEYVFIAAARVGGIMANSTYPAEFIQQNLAIQTNVIHESWRSGVGRLLFLGSSCIYPRDCPQPMKEEHLMSGYLEPTNRPYAMAKIAGVEMCSAYNRQYGTHYLAAMPTNLFGPGDNYDLDNSHVIPALIRKFHEAKIRADKEVIVWGTGKPRREFLYSDDAADACVFLMSLPDDKFDSVLRPKSSDLVPFHSSHPLINIGYGSDFTIHELAEMVKETVGYQGEIVYDHSKPDGTPQKLLDSSRLSRLGWHYSTDIREGLDRAYQDFLAFSAPDKSRFTIG